VGANRVEKRVSIDGGHSVGASALLGCRDLSDGFTSHGCTIITDGTVSSSVFHMIFILLFYPPSVKRRYQRGAARGYRRYHHKYPITGAATRPLAYGFVKPFQRSKRAVFVFILFADTPTHTVLGFIDPTSLSRNNKDFEYIPFIFLLSVQVKSCRKFGYLARLDVRWGHLFMNSGGILVKSPCFTCCTFEPQYSYAALAPLENHKCDDDSQPIEYVRQHCANCVDFT
jgi:hypothetical protein